MPETLESVRAERDAYKATIDSWSAGRIVALAREGEQLAQVKLIAAQQDEIRSLRAELAECNRAAQGR